MALLANTGFLFKKAGKLPDGIISVIKISYKFIKSWAMMILGKFKGKVWWTTGTSNSRKSLDGKTVRIFAYSRTREQSNERSAWNEAENRELASQALRACEARALGA